MMNAVSKSFASGKLPKCFDSVKRSLPFKPDPSEKHKLKDVAQAFVELQQARHDADYDLSKNFTRGDTVAFVERAKQAFSDWESVRKEDLAKIYLACFLVWKDFDKTR
jgi:hypothetical protein